MGFFLHFLLFIQNFFWALEQLTIFQINFLLTQLIKEKMTNYTFNSLTIQFYNHFKENVSKIIIVTNSIHIVRKIFNSKSHPYQIHTTAILSKLCHFFAISQENSIEFWECPSCLNQRLHKAIDKDSKLFNPLPIYPCKISWDYCKKINSSNIIKQWKMTFQASDGKERHFLELVNDDLKDIRLSYTKGGLWLQLFGHLNMLCACAMRAITNHALIGEYQLRFFPNEEFKCPCGNYPIKSRRHILYDCMRFNGYQNPRRDSLSYFIMFLIANPNAFVFIDNYQPIILR